MADPWASLWTDDDPPASAGVGAGADPWASLWVDDGEEDDRPWWSVDIPDTLRSGAAGLVGFPGRISAAGRAMSALPITLTGQPNPQWFGERLPGAAGELFRGGRETSEELAKTYVEEPLAAKAAEIAPENPARLFDRPIQAIGEGLLGSAGEIALAVASPVAGGAVAAASGAGGSLQDFEAQGVPEERARLAALGIGGIQGLLQGVSGGLLKSLPILSATSKKAAGEMIAKAFAAAGFPDMGAEAATIALETAATGKAPTVRTIAERLLQEGLTEGAAGGAVHAARSLVGTPPPDVPTPEPEPEPTPQEALEEVRRAIAETPGPVAIPEPGKVASLISRWLTPRGGLGEGQVTGEGGSMIEGATGGGSDTDLFSKVEMGQGMLGAARRMAQLDQAELGRAMKKYLKEHPGIDEQLIHQALFRYTDAFDRARQEYETSNPGTPEERGAAEFERLNPRPALVPYEDVVPRPDPDAEVEILRAAAARYLEGPGGLRNRLEDERGRFLSRRPTADPDALDIGIDRLIQKKEARFGYKATRVVEDEIRRWWADEGRHETAQKQQMEAWEGAKKARAKEQQEIDRKNVRAGVDWYLADPEARFEGSGLPEELRPLAENLTSTLGQVQRMLVESGILPPEWAKTYADREGAHLVRAYMLHDDPKRLAKVENSPLWEEVKQDLMKLAPEMPSLAQFAGDPRSLEGAVTGLMKASMDPKKLIAEWSSPLSGSYGGTVDPGSFKHRKDVAEPLRRLWGQYQDFGVAWLKTMETNLRTLHMGQIFQEIRDSELGKTMFAPVDQEGGTGPMANAAFRIPGEGPTGSRPGIGGMFTTEHLRSALEHAFTGARRYGVLGEMSEVVSAGLTVGSPRGQIRNPESNFFALLGNAHLFIPGTKRKGVRVALADFLDRSDAELRPAIERLHRQGLSDSSNVDLEAIRRILGDRLERMGRGSDIPRTGWGKVADKVGKVLSATWHWGGKTWALGDTSFKSVALEAEMGFERYIDPEVDDGTIENRAGEYIRQSYQNYQRLPRWVRELRQVPVAGRFVAFPVSSAINLANTAKRVGKDLTSDNPRRRNVGLIRLASLLASTSAQGTMATTGAFLASKALYLTREAYKAAFPDEDDGEPTPSTERLVEAAEHLRTVLPDYYRDSQIVVVKLSPNGDYGAVDLSYLNYHGAAIEPIVTMVRAMRLDDASIDEALIAGIRKATEPFTSWDPVLKALIEAGIGAEVGPGIGRPEPTREIYSDRDSAPMMAAKAAGHVATSVAPGFLTQPARVLAGVTGYESSGGKTYDPAVEAISFTGPRPLSGNYGRDAEREARRWKKETAEIVGDITAASRQLGPLAENTVAEAEEGIRGQFRQVRRLTEGLAFYGFNSQEADRRLVGVGDGIGKENLAAVRSLGEAQAAEWKIRSTRRRVLGNRQSDLLGEYRNWAREHPSALATEAKKERERLASRWERTWALLGEGPVPPLSF